jgi:transcriptional regulator with XRE-family HTH domain
MPRIDDHPLRLARMRRNVGQITLSRESGVNRSTISAIEEGRTVTPSPETLSAISRVLQLADGQLERELTRWQAARADQGPVLSLVAQTLLRQPSTVIATFPSFVAWRKKLAPSPTAFASMLGVNRQVVAGYEQGIRVQGMPDPLTHALLSVLKIDNDYLKVLQQLPPSIGNE